MDVSIIYVNYKTSQLIMNSICSVKKFTIDIEYQIIVVDNNSEDNSEELIHIIDPQIIYIKSKENIGFGRANNLAATAAKGNYIFFLNPDTILQNNAIATMVTFLKNTPQTGACGGNLVDAELLPANSFGRSFPSLFEELLSIFYLKRIPLLNWRSLSYNYTNKPLEVASIVGADLMVPKKILDKVGWFDPDFFMNFEETELCLRIIKAGYNIISLPEAKIIHLEGKSSYTNTPRIERYFDGQYTFFYKKYGLYGIKNLHRIIRFKCNLRWLCFKFLRNHVKQNYWQLRKEINNKVYTQFRLNKNEI